MTVIFVLTISQNVQLRACWVAIRHWPKHECYITVPDWKARRVVFTATLHCKLRNRLYEIGNCF